MKFCSLASGSRGNMLYVEDGSFKILIDVGVSLTKAEKLLSSIKIDPSSLSAILLTHEHVDHIQGVCNLSKKYSIPVYTYIDNKKLLFSLTEINNNISTFNDSGFMIGRITVMPEKVKHDSSCCFAFSLVKGGKKLTILTDLGCYDDNILDFAKGSDFLYIEANHDRDMLMQGKYPPQTKRRIISEKGHLSNLQAASFIKETIDSNLKNIMIGHISENNNAKEIAFNKIYEAIKESGYNPNLFVAEQNKPTEIIEV